MRLKLEVSLDDDWGSSQGHIRERFNNMGAMNGCPDCGARSEQVRAVCCPVRG